MNKHFSLEVLSSHMYLLENTKKIQAANVSASRNAEKLNFPMLIARVFSNVRRKSRKFSKSFFNTKKKNEQNAQNTIKNSTTKVESPEKQSLMVAEICMNALWNESILQNFKVDVKTVMLNTVWYKLLNVATSSSPM